MRFVTQYLILIAARTHFVLSKVMSQYVAFTAVHCELLLFTEQSLLYICRTLSLRTCLSIEMPSLSLKWPRFSYFCLHPTSDLGKLVLLFCHFVIVLYCGDTKCTDKIRVICTDHCCGESRTNCLVCTFTVRVLQVQPRVCRLQEFPSQVLSWKTVCASWTSCSEF